MARVKPKSIVLKPHQALKPNQKQILKTLLEHDYALNTTQVANKSNISWNTANSYLGQFHQNGWIDRKTVGNRDYWRGRKA